MIIATKLRTQYIQDLRKSIAKDAKSIFSNLSHLVEHCPTHSECLRLEVTKDFRTKYPHLSLSKLGEATCGQSSLTILMNKANGKISFYKTLTTEL